MTFSRYFQECRGIFKGNELDHPQEEKEFQNIYQVQTVKGIPQVCTQTHTQAHTQTF